MKYNILNTVTGEITRLTFENDDQIKAWVDDCPGFVNLGPCTQEYYTRHQRMNVTKEQHVSKNS